ncbi:hypothetical protein [Clostridioides difficile]|uniref:hypothetical protein n=1 Tax=Clostridioides difficile TaxID=1496 RepID=UPI001033A036|nr:hypothetical protein [Clostridioides difficile]
MKGQLRKSIFQKENADKPCRERIYRKIPTNEKIIKDNISFTNKKIPNSLRRIYITLLKLGWGINN